MRGWTPKDERKYEHIKKGSMAEGKSETKAKEIAARTVNKSRRLEGRTSNKRTMGTGNPREPFEEHSKDELENIAKEMGIKGGRRMRKADLVAEIKRRRD